MSLFKSGQKGLKYKVNTRKVPVRLLGSEKLEDPKSLFCRK